MSKKWQTFTRLVTVFANFVLHRRAKEIKRNSAAFLPKSALFFLKCINDNGPPVKALADISAKNVRFF